MFDLVREYSSRNARRDNCKDLVIIIISINTSMDGLLSYIFEWIYKKNDCRNVEEIDAYAICIFARFSILKERLR